MKWYVSLILSFLWKRAQEPSSYAAIAGMLTSLHFQLDAGVLQHVIDGLTFVSGVAGVLLSEAKKENTQIPKEERKEVVAQQKIIVEKNAGNKTGRSL